MAFNKKKDRCSFCGRDNVDHLLKGIDGFICDDCIRTCASLISGAPEDEHFGTGEFNLPEPLPTPVELKTYLDQYVIGQEDAKKVLSVAVHNHYKRIKYRLTHADGGDVEMDKSNILMIGPTGTGKTLLARTLAKRLNVPFAIADATTLTEAGYVGEDVENILLKLIENADGDIQKAEFGIIFIDEVDKISKKGENVSITRDVSGEGVQQALLKIIEGTVASVPPQGGRKHPNQEMLKINTENILFICGGAFVGLDKVVEQRVAKSQMGFGAQLIASENKDLSKLYKQIIPDDLMKFGLIPEFIGRLPILVTLDNLTKDDLRRIITEPKNSIVRQYVESFKIDGVELVFTPEAVDAIADKAIKQKTGARGLRSILENMMMDLMYELPSKPEIKHVEITREMVEGSR